MTHTSPAPPDLEVPDADIHGKLAHLNAVDLRPLTLSTRYAYITLLHPPNSDELGRFMTLSGVLPILPALTDKEANAAITGLIKAKLLRIWEHSGSTCFELAGAYAFKPDLKKQLYQRRKLASQKREEEEKRRQRKKDADEGIPFAYEDDGSDPREGKVIEKIRSQRGNLLPTRHGVFFSSKVPPPKKKQRHVMMQPQPDKTEGCVLRMLPSFNPGEDLCKLGAVLRFYLLCESDDYGRVRLDAGRLHQMLGPAITKRVSKATISETLEEMEKLGHLMVFDLPKGRFAYLRDSAQHMLKSKRYAKDIPRLLDEWDFTYDSEDYTAFFEACAKHSATRTTVHVASYSERGDLHVVSEYVEEAAKRFLEEHEKLLSMEPYCGLSPEQIMDRETTLNSYQSLPYEHIFWYAASTNQPAEWLEQHYLTYRDELDGKSGGETNAKAHKILTYLLDMTPAEFVERAKTNPSRPPVSVVP